MDNELLQKIRICLKKLIDNKIVKKFMLNTSSKNLEEFRQDCKKHGLVDKDKNDKSQDETCLENLIGKEIKRCTRYTLIKRPKSSNFFRKQNRELDIALSDSEGNIKVVIEIKLNYSSKSWGWDEAIIQTLMDALSYPKRCRIIIMFDKVLKGNLSKNEKSFLEKLNKEYKVYYFRYYLNDGEVTYETNLPKGLCQQFWEPVRKFLSSLKEGFKSY